MRWLTKIVTAFGLLLAAAAAAEERQISVRGEGVVDAVPDMAVISLSVVREARQAEAAVAAMAEAARAVLGELTEAGIDARDMQSASLELYPVRQNHDSGTGQPPRIVGYVAQTRIQVRVRDLDALGAILDRAIGDGANAFDGLSFGLQDPETAADEARRLAVADAARKAALYAEAAGVPLGDLISLSEGGGRAGPVMMEARSLAADTIPVAPGEVSLRAEVNLVYAIGDE